MRNEQRTMSANIINFSFLISHFFGFPLRRTGSPKGSPHLLLMGILLCATLCRIFHPHGCRRASPLRPLMAVKEKHYKPICACQKYIGVGFIVALYLSNDN